MIKLNKKGFTIIELLIATVVFSLVLLLVTGAIIQFNKVYYKGVITARTNQVATKINEEIASSIQYSSNSLIETTNGTFEAKCIGDKRYTFVRNVPLTDSQHVIVADTNPTPSGCSVYAGMTTPGLPSTATEMAGENMRIVSITTRQVPANSDTYVVETVVAYGIDEDLIDSDDPDTDIDSCTPLRLGGQFCAVSRVSTTITKRLE